MFIFVFYVRFCAFFWLIWWWNVFLLSSLEPNFSSSNILSKKCPFFFIMLLNLPLLITRPQFPNNSDCTFLLWSFRTTQGRQMSRFDDENGCTKQELWCRSSSNQWSSAVKYKKKWKKLSTCFKLNWKVFLPEQNFDQIFLSLMQVCKD